MADINLAPKREILLGDAKRWEMLGIVLVHGTEINE